MSTIVLCMQGGLVQQTACNVFNMFSNRIIVKINENLPDDSKIAANLGTQLLGIFAATSALVAP